MVIELSDYAALISEAKMRMNQCTAREGFDTGIPEAEQMLADIDRFPHHFVLACLMDRQVKAQRAWAIPYRIGSRIGGFDFSNYERLELAEIKEIFEDMRLHRFNGDMADIFAKGVRRIRMHYEGDAKNIWTGNPACARVIRRFLEFEGAGPKIATMAVNILIRQMKVPMSDQSAIDISADTQAMKYFQAKGLLRTGAKKEELIYLAREIYPDYPGILDLLAWEGGREISPDYA
jgi:endonuclease III